MILGSAVVAAAMPLVPPRVPEAPRLPLPGASDFTNRDRMGPHMSEVAIGATLGARAGAVVLGSIVAAIASASERNVDRQYMAALEAENRLAQEQYPALGKYLR